MFAEAGRGQSLCGLECSLVSKNCVVAPVGLGAENEEGAGLRPGLHLPRSLTSSPSTSSWSGTPRYLRILGITQQRRWLNRFYLMLISLIDNIKIIRTLVGEPAFVFMPRALKILGEGQVLTHTHPAH